MTATEPASLEDVLAYRNEEVILRFSEDHGIPVADSRLIFRECLRWLWVCARRRVDFEEGRIPLIAIPLLSEAAVIDQMWHCFLLFTRDYADFCERYFGSFIHHVPQTSAERSRKEAAWKEDPAAERARRKAELRPAFEYLYDTIGPEALRLWCEEFPARFSASLGRDR